MGDRPGRTGAPRHRLRAAAAVLAAAACVALGLAVPAVAAAPSPSSTSTPSISRTARPAASTSASGLPRTSAGGAIHYARIQPLCRAAKVGNSSCLALRRMDVPKGTADAVPYRAIVGAHGPRGGYSPADLAGVYKLLTASRTDAVVAIVDAYDNPRVRHELNRFDSQYSLPPENRLSLRVVNQAGGTVLPKTDWGWAVETALDAQAVRGMCNKCKILLVEASNASNKNLARAVNTAARLGADVISNSYGGPEAGADSTIRKAYRHRGVVITAATGDDGWYDWDFMNLGGYSDNMPNSPASLPSVVAVGGTTLTLNQDGSRAAESVWNGNGGHDAVGFSETDSSQQPGASGGGCSTRFDAAAWQVSVAGYAMTGCGARRMSGDLAAVGDPATGYSVYAPSQGDPNLDEWQVIGGTSLSAPLVAGMYGLAGGSGGVDYPAQSIYLNYKYHADWAHDVRTGGNGFCGGEGTAACSDGVRALLPQGGTGNPNNIVYSDDGSPLGKLDCSYSFDPTHPNEATVTRNTQCNAAAGYDGPSGVGTPNGVRLLRSAQPSVRLGSPATARAGVRQTYRALRFTDTIGSAVRYVWHWHDGTAATVTKRAVTTHVFASAGTRQVTLTVYDNLHRRVIVSAAVRVR